MQSPDSEAGGPSRAGTGLASNAGGFKPWPEQDENGVDLSLIREALRLTPTERIRRADRARRSALRVQDIGRRTRASRRTEPPSA
jgi:hypothetical protein